MPGGRPPKIDSIVDTWPQGSARAGEPMTAGDKVIERVRQLWAPWESAAVSADISRNTLLNWRKAGAAARSKMARGENATRNERRYAEFLGALEKAEEEAHLRVLGMVVREASGGYPIVKTVEKMVNGKVVEKTTTTETARPIFQAGAWLLERKRGSEYPRPPYEVTGAGGEPLVPQAERADSLAEQLEAFQAGLEAQRQRHEEAADGLAGQAPRADG